MPIQNIYISSVLSSKKSRGESPPGPTPPTAEFIGAPTSGSIPLTVTFTNQSLNATSYLWDFGDGDTSTSENPSHAYLTEGTYTVILTATGPGGSNQRTRTNYVSATSVAPGTIFTTFSLTSSITGTHPYSIGHVFKQGDVPAGASIDGIQTTVKSTWSDGSARIAVLAGTEALSSNVTKVISVRTGSAPSGANLTTADLKATNISATTVVSSFGTVNWTGVDWDSPFMTWISGPVMSSWVYRTPVGSDPNLVAWLEVRLWNTGAVEILPWVENGYLNVAGPTNKNATYTFRINGSDRFQAGIDLPNHCRTPLLNGTILSHWLNADPSIVVAHDATYMQETELVPSYFATVAPSAVVVTSLPSSFTPLQQGSYPASMGSAGYDASIGLIPEWDVLYLTSSATTVWAALQRNAYSAGRYGIHHRDENTLRPPRFSSYPTTLFGEGFGVESIGSSSTSTYTPNATGTVPASYAVTHHPSMGFMAYLVTGRFYHMETVQYLAMANYFKSSSNPRQNSNGVIQTWSSNATRGAAWSLRTLGQAAGVTPDDDTTLRTEFLTSFAANINSHYTQYAADLEGTMGWMEPYTNYTSSVYQNAGLASTSTEIVLSGGTSSTSGEYSKVFSNGTRWTVTIGGETRDVIAWNGPAFTATVSPAFTVPTAGNPSILSSYHWYEASWMQDFYTAAAGYTKCLGLALDSTTLSNFTDFFNWKGKSVVGRFGGTGATEYLYRDAASYTMAIAESETWENWYTDWGDVWTDTRLYNEYGNGLKEIGDGSLRGSVSITSFWGNLLPAIAYCVRHGVPGASAARTLMMSAPNYSVLTAEANIDPVQSVMPLTDPMAVPTWLENAPLFTWIELPNTRISDQPGNNLGATSGKQNAWVGWHIDERTGEIYSVGQGGHDDYWGNEVDKLDLRDNVPSWTQILASSNSSTVDFNSDYGTDGKPKSIHGYHTAVFHRSLNRALRMPGGSKSTSGNPIQAITAFNLTTGDWDPSSTWSSLVSPELIGGNNGAWAKHPVTEDVYGWLYNSRIVRWNQGTPGSFTTLVINPSNPAASATASAIDPTRGTTGAGEMFLLGGGSGGVMCRAFDIGNNSIRTITLTGTDISGVAEGCSLMYIETLDQYYAVLWGTGGSRVFRITPNSTSSWPCEAVTTLNGSGIPTTESNGSQWPYTKALYSPVHGCIVYGPKWTFNVWALPIHPV